MMAPRWRKAVRDLAVHPGRALLAVVAMAAGVFALSTMVFKYAILHPVLNTMYGNTRPASATLFTDSAGDALVDSVRRVPGVADAEARPVILARARVGDDWVPAILYVVRDFDGQRLDRFTPEAGAWPPGDGDLLLERSAMSVAAVEIGQPLTLKTSGGDERPLRVTGTVHAPGLAPAWMEHVVYGFVSWGSALRAAGDESAQIRILAAHPLDEGSVQEATDDVKAMLEASGHAVTRTDVPTPGRHPHADQMDTFMYLVGAFGILSFLLSAVLVASMVHGLLTEQVKQIGVMKAIGAATRQVAGIYLGQIAILCAAAMLIGIPLGLYVGRAYAQFSAGILNANVTRSPFPWWAVTAVAIVGVLVPMLVAMVPIVRASRITVHQALNDDPGARPFGATRLDRVIARLGWLPRPLALALRTTFRRTGRLALTVGTLAIAGAVFISARNVAGAWDTSITRDFSQRRYDLAVYLADAQPIDDVAAALAKLPSVAHAEYWPQASPYLVDASGVAGNRVSLIGPDPGSRLLALPVQAGRWLRPDDTTGVVINTAIAARNPALAVGGTIGLRLKGKTHTFPIVGIVKELLPMPAVYAPARAVRAATGQPGDVTRTIRVVTRVHSDAAQRAAAREIEQAFETMEVEVSLVQRMLDIRKSMLDHLVIITTILTMAAGLVVIVGGIGLASTLTLNVVQRTREIGILGAIGATPRTIAGHVWFEAVVIGVMSWAFATLLAAPISYVLEAVTGVMFLKVPLDFYMSASAAAVWLGLVVVLASACSLYPAWRAARLTVREAIAHA